MTKSVFYIELTPAEFAERLEAAPIAYLPMGTLEWHGAHLPLGSDGLQARGFFTRLANEVGGIVLPMLFLGPDKAETIDGCEYFGMDIYCSYPEFSPTPYPVQQLPGSAYWVSDDLFISLLDGILKQLARAGFRIVVAHGHGPSNDIFAKHIPMWKERYDMECYTCWGGEPEPGFGIQLDHAATNETSLMMALRPDLVHMENLPHDPNVWPLAVSGKDPRQHAGADLGRDMIEYHVERMSGLLRETLDRVKS